ncbi:uncharacterized protein LOC102346638 isoform X3 [Latimeria chalumnae]|uniref:uncharacterized protein LOC102346638 isoform X3 n=1 Tax=Latimeria chalumnae TaxID=7897 RepID=UPI00313E4F24
MASSPDLTKLKDQGLEPLKFHIQSSLDLLVSALYNVGPLLDHMIAVRILDMESYHRVQAERTPEQKARRLLDTVLSQLGEEGRAKFMECLRKCRKNYPRLQDWLQTGQDVTQGPTEQRLRHQSAELCHRLGQLTYPLSLRLFSRGTVCQYDLDDIQSQEHPFHQAQRLTSICAKKGEWACQEFYLALREEDPWLAQELEAETALEEPISSLDLPKAFPVAVQESEYPIPQRGVACVVRNQELHFLTPVALGSGFPGHFLLCRAQQHLQGSKHTTAAYTESSMFVQQGKGY